MNHERLQEAVSQFFGFSHLEVQSRFQLYHELHVSKEYARLLGETKTLSFEESFIILMCLVYATKIGFSVEAIVEIGTQFGKSARRLIDIKTHLQLHSKLICYDVHNEVRFFDPSEAVLLEKDITDDVESAITLKYASGLVFLDARPYKLIENVVRAVTKSNNWILVIHDCTRGLCKPNMAIDRSSLNISSTTGVWERHVLAEVFGFEHPLSKKLDRFSTTELEVCIFETQHGLCVILPKSLPLK